MLFHLICFVIGCVFWGHLSCYVMSKLIDLLWTGSQRSPVSSEQHEADFTGPEQEIGATEIVEEETRQVNETVSIEQQDREDFPILPSDLGDLDHPLCHYFIRSSHNSYISGNQLVGNSSIETVVELLLNKVRCIELDLNDGPNGPEIKHRWTLMKSIQAVAVFEAIKKVLKKDDLPVIVDLEDHLSDFQRGYLMDKMQDIFPDVLYLEDMGECLPTPNQLRGKLVVMASDKWRPLANICEKVPFLNNASFQQRNWYQVSSLSEHKLNQMLKSSPELVTNSTKNRLVRVYPGGNRQLSGNFNPVPALNTGCQFIALNQQTKDESIEICNSVFRHGGGTGFALKPQILIDGTPSQTGQRICVEILDGETIPKKHYLKLKVFQGLNKVSQASLSEGKTTAFDVETPELAYFVFKLKQNKYFGLGSSTVAEYAIPASKFSEGEKDVVIGGISIRLEIKFENLEVPKKGVTHMLTQTGFLHPP